MARKAVGGGSTGRYQRGDGGDGAPLHFISKLSDAQAEAALCQLQMAIELQHSQSARLELECAAARATGDARGAEEIERHLIGSHDALRRAQAVARMVRYARRMPRETRHEPSTGQLRRPPCIAAAIDTSTGLYHSYALYELRSGDVAAGGRFHVFITDIFNMRSLLPLQTCWLTRVASMLISLLQIKAGAEQQVVVLRALSEHSSGGGRASPSAATARLARYYKRIGFTDELRDFERNGLADSYEQGNLLFHLEPTGGDASGVHVQ